MNEPQGQKGRHSDESVTGHICGCVSFENGKITNLIYEMAKLRSPLFIMAESSFSPKWPNKAQGAGAAERLSD
jgi:hypothetical protein